MDVEWKSADVRTPTGGPYWGCDEFGAVDLVWPGRPGVWADFNGLEVHSRITHWAEIVRPLPPQGAGVGE